MNNVKAIQRITETELRHGSKKSWHDMYSGSAYIFIGGLNYDLTEGDVLSVFSQYGEIMNINLVKDKKTGKSKGFCFLCYENQKSTVLAVDNFNGIKLCGRTIRVDHVTEYRRPKDEHGDEIVEKGCAPKTPTPSPEPSESESDIEVPKAKKKKVKKSKDRKKKKKHKEKVESDVSDSEEDRVPKHKRAEKGSSSRHHGDSPEQLKRVLDEDTVRESKRRKTGESRFASRDDEKRDSRELTHRTKERKTHRERSRSRDRDRSGKHRK